jgi:hypothetical protein
MGPGGTGWQWASLCLQKGIAGGQKGHHKNIRNHLLYCYSSFLYLLPSFPLSILRLPLVNLLRILALLLCS